MRKYGRAFMEELDGVEFGDHTNRNAVSKTIEIEPKTVV